MIHNWLSRLLQSFLIAIMLILFSLSFLQAQNPYGSQQNRAKMRKALPPQTAPGTVVADVKILRLAEDVKGCDGNTTACVLVVIDKVLQMGSSLVTIPSVGDTLEIGVGDPEQKLTLGSYPAATLQQSLCLMGDESWFIGYF